MQEFDTFLSMIQMSSHVLETDGQAIFNVLAQDHVLDWQAFEQELVPLVDSDPNNGPGQDALGSTRRQAKMVIGAFVLPEMHAVMGTD